MDFPKISAGYLFGEAIVCYNTYIDMNSRGSSRTAKRPGMEKTMDALECMLTRRSYRDYKADSVPKELLDRIIEAGVYAPTGMGRQAPIIVAVTNKEERDRLSAANAKVMGSDGDPFYGAPVVLIVLAEKNTCPTYVYDGSLVMGNLLNAVHAVGLGGCWIHRAREVFEQPEWKEWLRAKGLEGEYEGIGNCVIGYPNGEPRPAKPRKANYVTYVE